VCAQAWVFAKGRVWLNTEPASHSRLTARTYMSYRMLGEGFTVEDEAGTPCSWPMQHR
jgi:hypothetical protein